MHVGIDEKWSTAMHTKYLPLESYLVGKIASSRLGACFVVVHNKGTGVCHRTKCIRNY